MLYYTEQIRRLVEDDSGLQAGGSTTMAAGARPSGPSDDVINNYWRGQETRFGVQIYSSGVISLSGNDAKGSVFAPQAFALSMAKEIDAEDDRDIRSRGTDIVTVGTWGETMIVDQWAVEVFSLASAIS